MTRATGSNTAVGGRRAGWWSGLFLLLIVAIVIGGIWTVWSTRPDQAKATQNVGFAVKQGPLLIDVAESGTIRPREQIVIKSRVEGRNTILYLIDEGVRVKKGDLLVELDASRFEDSRVDQEIRVQNANAAFIQAREALAVTKNQAKSDVEKAKLALRFAGEDLQQYLKGEYPNQQTEQEAKITLAEEEVQRAAERLKWSQVLFKEKYLAATELQADELAARKAQFNLTLARNNLALLKDFTYKRKVATLKSDLHQAEMALERETRKASAEVIQADAVRKARELELRRQKAKLAKIKEQISRARIVAPADGVVIYATSARANWRGNTEPLAEGQDVRERQELIYLPTASTFIAVVKIHESNLEKVRLGAPVRLTVDALPGHVFSGKVSKIAPLPDAQSIFMNPDLKIFRTEITVEGDTSGLRTGMSCRADIIVQRYENAIYIPIQAVVRIAGQPTAFVIHGNQTEARPLQLGLDNNRMVRVVKGLKLGEVVSLTPPLDQSSVLGVGQAKKEKARGVPRKKERSAVAGKTRPNTGLQSRSSGASQPTGGKNRNGQKMKKMGKMKLDQLTPEQRQRLRRKWQERAKQKTGKDGA